MNSISKHDVNKLTVAELKELLPFEVVADGEVVFVAHDVNRLNTVGARHDKASHDVNKAEEDFVVVGGVRLRRKG